MDIKRYREKLNKIFKENQVVLAYLFGSTAKGTTTPLSDIDIAVLFSARVKKDDYFDKRLKLASEIDKALKTGKTEVLALNQAPPLLKHRAVYYGISIYASDARLKRIFELRVLQEYEDFRYHLETAYKIMKRQIKEGTFGKPFISPHL